MIKRISFLFFFIFFSAISCKKLVISKPEKLLDENTMTDILYDLALLEGIQAVNPPDYDVSSIRPLAFIYDKYSIDSIVLHQNNAYYAANPEQYSKIHQKISERLALIETEKDTLINKQKKNIQEKILNKAIPDSVIKVD